MESEVEEQLYLLEIIVEDVDVSEEGILDTLREQVEIAEQQLKQQNGDGKDAKEVSAKDNVNTNEVASIENKPPADPDSNPNPPSENQQPTKPEKQPKQKTKRTAPVKVLAQFLDFPALEIKEKEFEKFIDDIQGDSKTVPNLQQGKSCLFSMSPKEIMDAIRKHPIVIQLHREGSDDEPAHLIGISRICLGQEFIDTIALGNTPTIAVTTIQGDYDVTNIFGDVTATVSLAIRLSCVGTTITTQFTYNQFDGNFKFSSSETVSKSDAAKNRKGSQMGQRGAFFHKDDALGIAVGPPPDCKLPASTVPWRKLHEDPSDVRSCGTKRLFKEQARSCYVDDTFDFGEFNPGWTPSVAKIMKAKCPGGICCGGQPDQTTDFVPPEFGTSLPPEVKRLLPCGKSEYEVPLDAQFASMNVNWGNPTKTKGDCNRKTEMRVCCAKTGQSGVGQTSGCPCMSSSSRPVYVCSNPKVNQSPPLEQSGPYLKSSPTDKAETSSFKRHLQYVPCPNSPDKPSTGNVTCGLEELLNQQNLKNLLQPSLMAPVCPPDSSGRLPSLCTCPKVPTVVPQPVAGGVVRCECTNILTAMKPIELPYTCPRPQEQQVEEAPTCPPCPPVPIKLPPPAPECPLAKLLKESQDQKIPSHCSKPVKQPLGATAQQVTAARPPKTETDLPDTVTDSNKSTTFPATDTTAKSGDFKPDHSSEKASEKSKKAHKVLQDEVTRSTTTTTYSMEPQMERAFSRPSKTASSTSSVATVPPKKRKLRQKVDEGRGSGYTPTRVVEPQPKELNIAYTPTAGKYPGYNIGHKNCIPIIPRVPKRMGWLWNIKDAEGFMKPGRGWRPGSIQTNVMKVMDNVKTTGKTSSSNKSLKAPPALAKTKSGDQHTRKVECARQMAHKTHDEPLMIPPDMSPTLHVHKKHGLHYVSMIPPPKDNARKKPKIKRMNSRGDMVDESDSDDTLPAQFRIDTKNPDGLIGNRDLYETDDTSTVSEDSYQMEVVAPSTLRHRQPQPVKTDMEVQVSENDFIRPAAEPKVHDGKGDTKKSGKLGKKKSSAASQKGKRGKGSLKNKK